LVVYSVDSDSWTYSQGLEVIQQFNPQFIVISRDPFSSQFPVDLKLLIEQSDKFKILYGDQLAVVFQIVK
jgi:hypothetical protein